MIKRLKNDFKLLLIVLIIKFSIISLLMYIFLGTSILFWISILLFVIFLFGLSFLLKKFGFNVLVISVVVLATVSISLNVVFSPRTGIVNTSSVSKSKTLTSEECKPLIEKYNNKVLKISENNLNGSIGIKIDGNCKFTARYVITFNAILPTNPIPDIPSGAQYTYENLLHKASLTERGHYGIGVLSIAKQNFMQLPDPFSTSKQVAEFYRNPGDYSNGTSNNFYSSFERAGNLSQDKYSEFLNDNVFEVVDSLPYIVKTPSSIGGFSYSVDSEKAEKEGKIVKTFNMKISE
ncbi:MAG: hypothetical protein WCK31_01455 [bacterium]